MQINPFENFWKPSAYVKEWYFLFGFPILLVLFVVMGLPILIAQKLYSVFSKW